MVYSLSSLILITLNLLHNNCVVDEFWYLSNQHALFKTTLDPMVIVVESWGAIPEELRQQGYDHIGDIDVCNGLIYGGIEKSRADGNGQGVLITWNTTDLSILTYRTTTQSGMPWVSVDPSARLVYSAVWNGPEFLLYDMDSFDSRGSLSPAGGQKLPGEIQGGAFWEGGLYLAVNGNCSVWRFDMNTHTIELALTDLYENRLHEYEMEGITFWDLDNGLGLMHMYGNFMEVKEKSIHNFSPVYASVYNMK